MKTITVVGMGYIGLPTAITLARGGFDVCGFDVNTAVLDSLRAGKLHIVEPGLQEALTETIESGRLTFSDTCPTSDAYIICVPTPFSVENGKRRADLKYVDSAAATVGRAIKPGALVILESTVPPRTTERMAKVLEESSGLSRDQFHTAHCPERIIPGQMLRELRENDFFLLPLQEISEVGLQVLRGETTLTPFGSEPLRLRHDDCLLVNGTPALHFFHC